MPSDIANIYGVGNIIQDISTKLQLDFHIGQQKFTNIFYALQNKYPLILGLDFLTKFNAKLDFENSKIELNKQMYDLIPPPTRSTLVKSKHAQIIDAYTSMDIPVVLTKPVETASMLVEPISSLHRTVPGLEIPLAVVSSQYTCIRVTNDTDTPLPISPGCVLAIARSVALNDITEMVDFVDGANVTNDTVRPTDGHSMTKQRYSGTNVDCFTVQPGDGHGLLNQRCDGTGVSLQVDLGDSKSGHGANNVDSPDLLTSPVDNDDHNNDSPDADTPQFHIENPNLSAQQIAELITFLLKNKKVFASTLAKLGHSTSYYHTIDTGDAKPVALRFYRTSPRIQAEIDKQIEELLRYHIISPSTSSWSSPVVMVRKPDKSYRMAIDFRQVNRLTAPKNYPIPRLTDIFDQIGEAKPQIFSTLDMGSGFWQIAMSEKDKDKTAFVTKNAKYVFNRMPFGLSNAPHTFQMATSSVLQDLLGKCCCVYSDDILCYSPDLKTHIKDLQKIFDRLIKAGFTLKPSKCKFAVQKITYLGHELTPSGILPNESKVQVIRDYPKPKNVTEVRRFLGMTQYYRRFMKNYAHIARPLQHLTKHDAPFDWTPPCQQAFEKMIEILTTAPLLAYPDCNKSFLLSCDASSHSIGYVLSQIGEDGLEHPIEYNGRALRKSELNYSVSDKEAVVEGFRKYHTYLYSQHTTVITDHLSLEHVYKNPKLTGRIARWNILLQNYDFTVKYKKGKLNANADAISRLENLPQPDNDNPDDIQPKHADLFVMDPPVQDVIQRENHFKEYVLFESAGSDIPSVMPMDDIDIVAAQKQCPQIGPIYHFINTGNLPDDVELKPSIVADAQQYFIKDAVLHHLYQPRVRNLKKHKPLTSQIVIPKSLRPLILSEYHDSLLAGAHSGALRTYAAIRDKYFWPGCFQDCVDYKKTCYPCQSASNYKPKPPPLGRFPPFMESSIWSRVHMDFLGPIKESKDKKKYILLVVDAFSKWPEAFALSSCDAITVARVLYKEIFCRYGAPSVLISDRGANFMASLVQALCTLFGVKRNMTSPYRPQCNAVCERLNSQINRALRTYVNSQQDDWPDVLPGILMAFRNTPADNSIEFSPYFILFCQNMVTPLDVAIQGKIPEVSPHYRTDLKTFIDNVQLSRHIANENLERHLQENKQRYDAKSKPQNYRIGQYVWLYNPAVPVGHSNKIRAKWCGPYLISQVHDNNTYRIRHYHTNLESPTLINGARLKLAHLPYESAIRQYIRRQQRQQNVPVIPDQNPRQIIPEHNEAADHDQPNVPPDQRNAQPDQSNTQIDQPNAQTPIEKVVDLSRNTKGRWYRVKFQGFPATKWVQDGFFQIPPHLIEECLKKRTWQGTARKRKRKKSK